jgi:hypothetical protein
MVTVRNTVSLGDQQSEDGNNLQSLTDSVTKIIFCGYKYNVWLSNLSNQPLMMKTGTVFEKLSKIFIFKHLIAKKNSLLFYDILFLYMNIKKLSAPHKQNFSCT